MRGSCTPCPIKALARTPRATRKEAPARSPKLGKYGNEESYGKVQGSAGEGRHGICGMPGGLAKNTMEGPLWRETLGRSLGLHDAAELVGGMCHDNGCRHARNHRPPRHILHKKNTIGCSTRHWLDPFERAKSSLLLKIHALPRES